eukprot:s113_g36.t1
MKAELSVKGSPSMKGSSPKTLRRIESEAMLKPSKQRPSLDVLEIAARRGFQPTLAAGAKGGAPLSISTKKEQPKRKEKRRIKAVDSIHNHYKIGETVMPSSHSGMSVVFAKRPDAQKTLNPFCSDFVAAAHSGRVEDGMDVVIKVRAKANSFVDRAEEREWRHNTEFMLNLPETEGIAKLYEVLEDRKGYYVIMEKVAGQERTWPSVCQRLQSIPVPRPSKAVLSEEQPGQVFLDVNGLALNFGNVSWLTTCGGERTDEMRR